MNAMTPDQIGQDIRISFREQRQREEREARRRVMALLRSEHVAHDEPDHGQGLGAAWHNRPHVVADTEGVSRGSAAPGRQILAIKMLVECELDRLRVNQAIDDREWRAGMNFRQDWLIIVRQPKVTANYGETLRGGSPAMEVSERRECANKRLVEAMAAMGMLAGTTVTAVCGQDESSRGRLPRLREGLGDLTRHYKVPVDYTIRATGKGR